MRPSHLALIPLCAALASCAAPGSSPSSSYAANGEARQCFQSANVRSFSDAGQNVALVSIGAREAWELTLSPGCPSVAAASKIGIVSRGRTRICSGSDAELLIPNLSGSGSQRCLVRSVRKLGPEEAAAARGLKTP